MNFTKTSSVLVALIGAAGLALSSCSSAGSNEANQSIVYDVGSANPQISMAPYTSVPDEMGYWTEQGLDVKTVYSQGSSAALQSVLGGSADIAVSGTNTTYSAALANPELRIVSYTPHNPWRIAVPEESNITSVEQLKGTDIGVISMTSGSYQYGQAIVASSGMDPEADVQWLPIGNGTQATEAIESNRVSAYSSYDGPLDIVSSLTSKGLRPLPSPLDEVKGSLAYVVKAKTLEEKPEAIEKFLRGTYQGYVFGNQNPEAAVQLYWKAHPDQRPSAENFDAELANSVEVTKNAWAGRGSPGDDGIWGYLNDKNIQSAADFFTKYKLVEGNVDAMGTADMSITKKASEFDEAAVKKQADEWKEG
ncbi:ABC transporter substrate-binding protein [Corynebacterium sp. S7]